jgi:transposase InsO family protein
MCRVLEVSRSGYHDWLAKPVAERERRDADLAIKARAVFTEHQGRYGSPRVCEELRARGETVSEKRVARVMHENGLVARPKKRFVTTTDSSHDDPIAPNLLDRDFTADGPNRVWVTDVTCIWTLTGWLYLAAILDLYSRRVVGWATSANNDRFLALDALRCAVGGRRPTPGLVHHSDRGSPYASDDYRAALTSLGMVASMSRKGDC